MIKYVLFNINDWTPQTSMKEYLNMGFEYNNIDLYDEYWRYEVGKLPKKLKEIKWCFVHEIVYVEFYIIKKLIIIFRFLKI